MNYKKIFFVSLFAPISLVLISCSNDNDGSTSDNSTPSLRSKASSDGVELTDEPSFDAKLSIEKLGISTATLTNTSKSNLNLYFCGSSNKISSNSIPSITEKDGVTILTCSGAGSAVQSITLNANNVQSLPYRYVAVLKEGSLQQIKGIPEKFYYLDFEINPIIIVAAKGNWIPPNKGSNSVSFKNDFTVQEIQPDTSRLQSVMMALIKHVTWGFNLDTDWRMKCLVDDYAPKDKNDICALQYLFAYQGESEEHFYSNIQGGPNTKLDGGRIKETQYKGMSVPAANIARDGSDFIVDSDGNDFAINYKEDNKRYVEAVIYTSIYENNKETLADAAEELENNGGNYVKRDDRPNYEDFPFTTKILQDMDDEEDYYPLSSASNNGPLVTQYNSGTSVIPICTTYCQLGILIVGGLIKALSFEWNKREQLDYDHPPIYPSFEAYLNATGWGVPLIPFSSQIPQQGRWAKVLRPNPGFPDPRIEPGSIINPVQPVIPNIRPATDPDMPPVPRVKKMPCNVVWTEDTEKEDSYHMVYKIQNGGNKVITIGQTGLASKYVKTANTLRDPNFHLPQTIPGETKLKIVHPGDVLGYETAYLVIAVNDAPQDGPYGTGEVGKAYAYTSYTCPKNNLAGSTKPKTIYLDTRAFLEYAEPTTAN